MLPALQGGGGFYSYSHYMGVTGLPGFHQHAALQYPTFCPLLPTLRGSFQEGRKVITHGSEQKASLRKQPNLFGEGIWLPRRLPKTIMGNFSGLQWVVAKLSSLWCEIYHECPDWEPTREGKEQQGCVNVICLRHMLIKKNNQHFGGHPSEENIFPLSIYFTAWP